MGKRDSNKLFKVIDKGFSNMYAVYDKEKTSPCLNTMSGGVGRQPMIVDEVVTLGNYTPGQHNASKVVDKEYSAPTVRENHGTVTAIVDDTYKNRKAMNKKAELADALIKEGKVQENDVIRHSYTASRMNGEFKDAKQNNICPTLDTRSDCLGVVNDLRIRKLTPRECFRLMGVKDEDFDKLSNMSNSTLYHLAGDSIVTTVLMAIFGELLEVEWKEKANSLHRLNNDGRKE